MRTIEAAFYDSSYRKCRFLNSLSGSKILCEFFYSCNREMNERMCFSKPVRRDSDLKFVSMIYNQRNLIILYIFIYQKTHFIKVIKLTDQILELHNKISQRKKFHILNLLIFIIKEFHLVQFRKDQKSKKRKIIPYQSSSNHTIKILRHVQFHNKNQNK